MGIMQEEAFVRILTGNGREQHNLEVQVNAIVARGMPYGAYQGRPARIDEESARRMFLQIKDYIKRTGYLPGKYLRPWEHDPGVYGNLNRAEPWWGMEFEIGLRSQAIRADVIEHTWNSWDNVVFDSEGEGTAAVEITFAPQEQSKYLDGTANAVQFMEYLCASGLWMQTADEGVGTHLNISHKGITSENVGMLATSMMRTLAAIPKTCPNGDTRKHMFGRASLYGGFYSRGTGDKYYLEGKLFRTTYDMDQFRRYLKVCEALSKSLAALLPHIPRGFEWRTEIPYVDNLYDVAFNGADPIIKTDLWWGPMDGARGNNHINGRYANDSYKRPTFKDGMVDVYIRACMYNLRLAQIPPEFRPAFDRLAVCGLSSTAEARARQNAIPDIKDYTITQPMPRNAAAQVAVAN